MNKLLIGIFFAGTIFLVACGAEKKAPQKHAKSSHKEHKKEPEKADNGFVRKYSEILGVELDKKCNRALIEEVSDWLGTKYKAGGNTKAGTDCSGFVSSIYQKVYGKSINRSSGDIFKQIKEVPKSQLKEGDILFFKIKSSHINHVGLYLNQGKFIHSSTSKGVIVNSLEEDYYSKYFFAAGRF